MRYICFCSFVCCLLFLNAAVVRAVSPDPTNAEDSSVLRLAGQFIASRNAPHFVNAHDLSERLPKPIQRYQLALVAWALLRPTGVQETKRSKNLEAMFWLAFRSLCQAKEKAFARRVIDDCQLKSGDLALALELLYRDDDSGLRSELKRRGIPD